VIQPDSGIYVRMDALFVCLISKDRNTHAVKIKTLKSKHTCDDAFKNKRVDYAILAHYFKNKVQHNPKFKVSEMRREPENGFNINVSKYKLKRAKRLALEKLEGSFLDDYNKLEAYSHEIKQTNPGSDIVINISKEALLEGLRPFIRLGETFLKGKVRGQLLVAISQDSMSHFYPIVWVVVDKENSTTWT